MSLDDKENYLKMMQLLKLREEELNAALDKLIIILRENIAILETEALLTRLKLPKSK